MRYLDRIEPVGLRVRAGGEALRRPRHRDPVSPRSDQSLRVVAFPEPDPVVLGIVQQRTGLADAPAAGKRGAGQRRLGVAVVVLERHLDLDLLAQIGARHDVVAIRRRRDVGLGAAVCVDSDPLILVCGILVAVGVGDSRSRRGQGRVDLCQPRDRRRPRRRAVQETLDGHAQRLAVGAGSPNTGAEEVVHVPYGPPLGAPVVLSVGGGLVEVHNNGVVGIVEDHCVAGVRRQRDASRGVLERSRSETQGSRQILDLADRAARRVRAVEPAQRNCCPARPRTRARCCAAHTRRHDRRYETIVR